MWEVACAEQRVVGLDAVEHLAPHRARHLRVSVGRSGPINLLDLWRRVRQIADDRGPLAARRYQHRLMAGGVARGWQERDIAADGALTIHQIDEPLLEQCNRPCEVGRPLCPGWLAIILPVLPRREIAGTRKRWLRFGAETERVPADVIAVQVRKHDQVHVRWSDSRGPQLGQQLAGLAPDPLVGPRSKTSVDQDDRIARPDGVRRRGSENAACLPQ